MVYNWIKGYNLAKINGNKLIFLKTNFTVHSGSCLIIQGINGSGKSTFLKLIIGLKKLTLGELFWKDQKIKNNILWDLFKNHINYISGLNGLFPELTVEENLYYWIKLYDLNEIKKTYKYKFLKVFFLIAKLKTLSKNLSQGQQRKLALVRLILIPKSIWVLDEPLITLDTNSIKIFEKIIEQHRLAGGIVILSTHANMRLKKAITLNLDELFV